MTNELLPGQRIRLKTLVRRSGCLPGDRGVVLSGCQASDFGWLSYYVRMQGQNIGSWTVFAADEIENVSVQAPATHARNDRRTAEKASEMGKETKVSVLTPTFIPLDELDGSDSKYTHRGDR